MARVVLVLSAETLSESLARMDVRVFNTVPGYAPHWIIADRVEAVTRETFDGAPAWLVPKARSSKVTELVWSYVGLTRALLLVSDCILREAGRPALILVRDDPSMALVALRLRSRLRVPVAYQISHLKEEETLWHAREGLYRHRTTNYIKGKVGLILRNWCLKRVDLVLPISVTMSRTLASIGVPESRMCVLPTGVQFESAPERWDADAHRVVAQMGLTGRRILVYVGTMNRFRKLDFLFLVLREVLRRVDAHLLMVGEGLSPSDLRWLQKRANEVGVADHVTFTGRVEPAYVPVYIRAAEVGLSPFPPNPVLVNNAPIKVLEYINLGVPVVATDIPEQQRVIRESGGGFVVSHSVDKFAEAILKMLDLPAPVRRMMAERGRQWIRQHRDVQVLAAIAREAFDGLLEGGARRSQQGCVRT